MRYHSRSPLLLLSPSLPLHGSVQRSNPTCSISLTSVCASGKARLSSSDAIFVDPLPTVLVAVSPIAKAKVPFPKRPHSLLRCSQPEEGNTCSVAQESDEANLAQDCDPPRKRTRTSALSSSRRTHSYRPSLTPARISSLSVPLLLRSPTTSSSFITLSASSPTTLHPCTASSSSSSHVPSVCDDLVSEPVLIPLSVPPHSNAFRGRAKRLAGGEIKHLLHLYRTLVYGLEVRYSDRPGNMNKPLLVDDTNDAGATAGRCQIQPKSYFDVQDALLAQHLKGCLLASGIDAHSLVVNVDDIAQEGTSADPARMEVDDSSSGSHTMHPDSFLHPHLHASTTHSILSYQQLVASHIVRRRVHHSNRQPSERCSSKQRRKSTLAISSDEPIL